MGCKQLSRPNGTALQTAKSASVDLFGMAPDWDHRNYTMSTYGIFVSSLWVASRVI